MSKQKDNGGRYADTLGFIDHQQDVITWRPAVHIRQHGRRRFKAGHLGGLELKPGLGHSLLQVRPMSLGHSRRFWLFARCLVSPHSDTNNGHARLLSGSGVARTSLGELNSGDEAGCGVWAVPSNADCDCKSLDYRR
jgi:hypothetical protein